MHALGPPGLPAGIVLFELFHELVQQLAEDGGSGSPSSPLQVLPLLASQIARLAAGGVAVGLAGGWLTRRLLRVLRWYGASASQVGGGLCFAQDGAAAACRPNRGALPARAAHVGMPYPHAAPCLPAGLLNGCGCPALPCRRWLPSWQWGTSHFTSPTPPCECQVRGLPWNNSAPRPASAPPCAAGGDCRLHVPTAPHRTASPAPSPPPPLPPCQA